MIARIAVWAALFIAAFLGGMRTESSRRDAQALATERAAAQETQRLIERNYRAGADLATTTERERTATRTIKEQVHVYLPPTAEQCQRLPAGLRVLHDAAATGTDPAAQPRVDAPGPTVTDVAQTLTDNYGTCRLTAARLSACQQYIREIVRPNGLTSITDEVTHEQQQTP